MHDTVPLGWQDRAVNNLIREANHNDELFRATMAQVRRTPKIVVDSRGISRPRRSLKSLAQRYKESSDFYRRYAQQLKSRNA